jgi:hypothetical protein
MRGLSYILRLWCRLNHHTLGLIVFQVHVCSLQHPQSPYIYTHMMHHSSCNASTYYMASSVSFLMFLLLMLTPCRTFVANFVCSLPYCLTTIRTFHFIHICLPSFLSIRTTWSLILDNSSGVACFI